MNLLGRLFGKKIDGPEFIKDFDIESNKQLAQLNELLERVGDDQKPILEEQIKLINIGLIGEKSVYHELMHSYLPLLALHDIRLEYNGLTSQFDYIIICHNYIMVLETKSLIGDIVIDSGGNFIRVFKDYKGTVYKKEGMYSPISQNQKHVDLLRKMLTDYKIIKRLPIYSLVVVANPKTIIDKKYAQKDVKNVIIKHDQIKSELEKQLKSNTETSISDKAMYEIANFILANDKPIVYDYIKRFNLKIKTVDEEEIVNDNVEEVITTNEEPPIVANDELYETLRAYRIEKAKEKNIDKLYFIFTNKELEQVVLNQPKTKEELLQISGFGEKKWQEYGEDIIDIVKTFLKIEQTDNDNENNNQATESIENTKLYETLRKYRLNKSKEEDIKPYFIYNNKELEALCISLPKTIEELLTIPGFGEARVSKYGQDIIDIIKEYN